MDPRPPQLARPSGARDLPVFNRWNCLTRIRSALIVGGFALLIDHVDPGTINVPGVLATCAFLFAFGAGALALPARYRAGLGFFILQALVDVVAATAAIRLAAAAAPDLILLHCTFAIIIVPAALISISTGLLVAVASTMAHALLLGLARGFVPGTFASVEFFLPVFLFTIVAQQSFFYGGHLARKNTVLAALYDQLAASGRRLAAEGRLSAAVAETARTLSATLDAAEPLARVSDAICRRLGADWCAVGVLDERARVRLRGLTGADADLAELAQIDIPLASWPGAAELPTTPICELAANEMARLPSRLTGGHRLAEGLLVALRGDERVIGFVAVGFGAPLGPAREWVRSLLAGIAEHATIVLQNARLLEEVRQASALKSEFVGAVSHELRSPLNVILGYLEMTLDGVLGPLTAEQGTALERTQTQARTLLEMITALLDLNRFEAGRLPVERSPVAVAGLLAEIVDQLPETWRRPQVRLHVDAGRAPALVETDRGKLKTILRNLVHNALKFTEAGQVVLAAESAADGGVVLTVTDTGRGIPSDALPYVFDMFRQVPGTTAGGVGLGLHIVRRFVTALGGTVSVASTPGRGSCFTVTLPAGIPGAPAATAA